MEKDNTDYEVCYLIADYLNNLEPKSRRLKPHEIGWLAHEMFEAMKSNDRDFLLPYYEILEKKLVYAGTESDFYELKSLLERFHNSCCQIVCKFCSFGFLVDSHPRAYKCKISVENLEKHEDILICDFCGKDCGYGDYIYGDEEHGDVGETYCPECGHSLGIAYVDGDFPLCFADEVVKHHYMPYFKVKRADGSTETEFEAYEAYEEELLMDLENGETLEERKEDFPFFDWLSGLLGAGDFERIDLADVGFEKWVKGEC